MSDEEQGPGEDRDSGGGGFLSVVLPFVTAIASLALGAVLGAVVGWLVKPADVREVAVPRDLTAAEIEAMCAPAIAETASELEAAHAKVSTLTADVSTKQKRVEELETEMKRRSDAGRSMAAELDKAKRDLAEALAALKKAEEEKAALVEELNATVARLEETEEALEEQKDMTNLAKEDALTNKWFRFLNDAQLEICEKGNRKRLGRCRETVIAELKTPKRQAAFAHCVRSKQATPMVREIQKDESLPQYAEFINEEEKITKDWYLLLCDPTLPEADGFLGEEHLPPTQAGAGE